MKDDKKIKGNKMIKPSDNPKPFTKGGINGKTFEKWTEDKVHSILDFLESWLLDDIPVYDSKGKQVGIRQNDNCFYKEFLYKERLYDTWIANMSVKFSTVKKRMEEINLIQEHKLQILAAKGTQKENITKFILTNKYNWKEKVENENTHSISNINIKDLIEFEDTDEE